MDYTKFFAKRTHFRKDNLIRRLTKVFMQNPDSINLASGMPNASVFPFQNLTVTYNNRTQTLTPNEMKTALQYGASQGHFPLVKKWKEFQTQWHNPPFKNWDVAIVPGSQDGYWKILELVVDEGDPVMVQAPTYPGSIAAIHAMRPEYIGISQDNDGIIPEEIEKICESRARNNQRIPKVLCVNPIGANPTGTVLTDNRKREIYKLAQKYDFLIVEDDAYFFLHFMDKQPVSFLSLDTDGRVIRLDSFSKIMSSGLRLGTVTAHEEVINKLIVSLQNTVLHASSLSQVLITKLLEEWTPEEFDGHINKIQSFYKSQRDMMLRSVEKHLKGLAEWIVPKAGMFIWLKLNIPSAAFDPLMQKMINSGVYGIPGHAFYYETQPDLHLRLSYSFSTEEQVEKGMEILAKLIKEVSVEYDENDSCGGR